MPTTKRKPSNGRKTSRRGLTVRQRQYIKNKLSGMSAVQAALKAGYTAKTANKATTESGVEKGRVKTHLARLMDKKGLTDERLLDVTEDGLKAEKRWTSHTEPDSVVPDHPTRHKFLETALRLRGHGKDVAPQTVDARQQIIVLPSEAKPESHSKEAVLEEGELTT